MVPIIIAIVSVLAIAGSAFTLQRAVPTLRPARAQWFCPVCIGVSMSWLWILAGVHMGWLTAPNWIVVAAILIGGSVVGIADRLSENTLERQRMSTKFAIVVVGFAVAYAAIRSWFGVAAAVVAIVAVALVLAQRGRQSGRSTPSDKTASELKRKLEHCC